MSDHENELLSIKSSELLNQSKLSFSVLRLKVFFKVRNFLLFFFSPVSFVVQHGQSQFIGICLPYVCNKDDVYIMMKESMVTSDAEGDREAEVIRIKSHYDYYYMAHDRTFWLVM